MCTLAAVNLAQLTLAPLGSELITVASTAAVILINGVMKSFMYRLIEDATSEVIAGLEEEMERGLAQEMLESPETLGASHTLVSLVLFDRAHLTFGREIEIAVPPIVAPGTRWIDHFLLEIQHVFAIPPDAVRFVSPVQTSNVDVTEMAHLPWFNRDQAVGANFMSPWTFFGDRFVVSDARVPNKVLLSPDDRLGLQRRIDAANKGRIRVDVGWSVRTVDISSIAPAQNNGARSS